jgi:hypothetical protein
MEDSIVSNNSNFEDVGGGLDLSGSAIIARSTISGKVGIPFIPPAAADIVDG